MSKKEVPVVVLLGPTGSGKSTFVKNVTREHVEIGAAGSAKPCTKECKTYTLSVGGDKCTIIDTPGFGDSPPDNIRALTEIARTLQSIRPHELTGAVYFHRITDGRLTGTLRMILEIFKKICGDGFFPRVAFVTTMWDIVGPVALSRYNNVNLELQERHFKLAEGVPNIFKCSNNEASCLAVLKYFTGPGRKPPLKQLLLLQELRPGVVSGGAVKKTSAGKEILRKAGGGGGGGCVIL
ncbi:P-loop containing nucleoside triphosphate hydrolase protein [Immersiella caudata]|uniref:P-loop containing nucleoside triphosphate hydrolase protein n=1 Tax=Immersiella caudata TaxID=314043 RepID=A0AA39WQ24_9PEZI|nr:P-loop containing nucleoside triphosphate hydrolase protein [Immersiella caudata]